MASRPEGLVFISKKIVRKIALIKMLNMNKLLPKGVGDDVTSTIRFRVLLKNKRSLRDENNQYRTLGSI